VEFVGCTITIDQGRKADSMVGDTVHQSYDAERRFTDLATILGVKHLDTQNLTDVSPILRRQVCGDSGGRRIKHFDHGRKDGESHIELICDFLFQITGPILGSMGPK
jgi:hypothetical protein